MFRHSCIYVRKGAGIRTPADLKGKRVGATQFASTGVVFIKGMLQHEYGVAQSDMRWFIGGLDAPAHKPPAMPQTAPGCRDRISLRRQDHARRPVRGRRARRAVRALHSEAVRARLAGHRAAVSGLSDRRAGLRPPHRHLPGDAHRRDPRGRAPRASVGRDEASTRRSATRATSRWTASTTPMRCGVSLPWLIDHIEDTRRALGMDFFAYGLEGQPAGARGDRAVSARAGLGAAGGDAGGVVSCRGWSRLSSLSSASGAGRLLRFTSPA